MPVWGVKLPRLESQWELISTAAVQGNFYRIFRPKVNRVSIICFPLTLSLNKRYCLLFMSLSFEFFF